MKRACFVMIAVIVSHCTKDDGIVLPKRVAQAISDRVVRTDTSSWMVFTCTPGAVTFEVPKNAKIGCTGESGVTIGMHEIQPPLAVIDDITYGLYITLQRRAPSNSADEEKQPNGSTSVRTADWMTSRHTNLEKIADG